MDKIKKYTPFFASATLMCIALFIIYPHYQYYIDPDGTAYLTIAKRYANGDIQTAINGYWSPWACWLTAGLIKLGFAAIPAGVTINSVGAIGFLFISQSFFLRFDVVRKLQWMLGMALVVFLCYAVFWQSFDDLWECFFLLSALRLMLAESFIYKPALWVIYGLLGALAYFAKAYSFPFFILNTVCCIYFIAKDNKARWLRVSAVAILVMLFGSHFWIVALHHKYGIWTTSTAGSLNMSWYLVGHPYWKEGIKFLIPPAYKGSPYYWEDPYLANGVTPHFWNSWHLFGLQFLRIGLNIWKFIVSSFQLSLFFIVIVGYTKWVSFWERGAALSDDLRVLMISFLLFTVGYVLVNFESRYLWYMLPASMIIGAIAIQKFMVCINKPGLSTLLFVLFALSYIICPVYRLGKMYDEGKEDYRIAQCLKNHLKGAFTAEANAKDVQKIARIAYFSGNPYYNIPKQYINTDALMQEMYRYNIKYCLYYPDYYNKDPHLVDKQGDPLPEFINDTITGLKVFIANSE